MAGKVNLADFLADETSQTGENGIIDKVFEVVGTTNKVCIEFGAHDLRHLSNIAPLWMEQGWKALLIEADPVLSAKLNRDYEGLSPVGEAVIVEARVEVSGENSLDSLLARHGIPAEPDLLGIDVDGTDYHIWKSLKGFRPRLVVIEYNATVPPRLSLVGRAGGNSFGASALALSGLGKSKGYALIACTKSNLIFTLSEYADRFRDSDNLERLFDDSGLCYVMRTFEGGLMLSKKPTHGFNPFSCSGERSLEEGGGVYFPDKSFRHLLGLWMQEMRVRARNNPLQRGILVALAGCLHVLGSFFGWIFKDPDSR